MSPSEVVVLGTQIAVALAKNKNSDEIAVLRSLAAQVAATLLTYSAQKTVVTEYCNKDDTKK